MDDSLLILDHEVHRAALRARRSKRLLRGPDLVEAPNPLMQARRVSSRATFRELEANAARDEVGTSAGAQAAAALATAEAPLREALRGWVYALTLDRVCGPTHSVGTRYGEPPRC